MLSARNILLLSLSALGAFAAPTPQGGPFNGGMTDAQAKEIGGLWVQLIGNYTKELAEAALTSDYADYSASALSLNNNCQQAPGPSPPLETPVFTSREQFELGQGSQPPIASTVLFISHNATQVTMRYKMTNIGTGSRPVVGLIAIDTVKAPAGNKYPYQIKTTYSEFDSAAWISNLKDANNCKAPAA